MADQNKWIVTLSAGHSPEGLRRELSETGFHVDQVLEAIGVVVGEATADIAAKVRSLPGIADVARESSVDIGPPDRSW